MYNRILVVVENDPATNSAVEQGIALAREHSAELVFLAIVPETAMPLADYPFIALDASDAMLHAAERKVQGDLDAASQLADEAGVHSRAVKAVAQHGAACVVDTSRELSCDLVIIESLGRNSVMRLLAGSLIPGLITLSALPVMVVRHGAAATRDAAAGMREATTGPMEARH